jgi:isochorismate hydrolase
MVAIGWPARSFRLMANLVAETDLTPEVSMTTLSARPNTALAVIDVQNGAVGNAYRRDDVVANINRLVAEARAAKVPVIWVQHSDGDMPRGSDAWQYVEELRMEPSEPVVHKSYGDSFEETDLEQVLAERGIGQLVVAGAQTDACIRSTLHGALVRGYDVTLVGDAHTTEDLSAYGAPPPEAVIAHTNLYWRYQSAPGRKGGTLPTSEISFTGAN